MVHQHYYSHCQSPAGTVCGSEQPALIYSLLWCDTESLKCFHSTKIVIVWKLTGKYSDSQYVPTDPPHPPQQSHRGRWATRNSRENQRFVFPQERSAEKLANHSPASLKGSWTWTGRGLLGSETWEELGFLSSERQSNTSRWESPEVFACEVLKLICVSCFH